MRRLRRDWWCFPWTDIASRHRRLSNLCWVTVDYLSRGFELVLSDLHGCSSVSDNLRGDSGEARRVIQHGRCQERFVSLRSRMLVPALSLLAIVPTSLRANCELRCSCAYAPAPRELASAAAVFRGEVTRIVPRTDTRVGSAIVTVFRSWKGVNTGTVNIDLADSLTRN